MGGEWNMFKRKCFKCNTTVEKNMVYCPECGVNIDQYFKDNQTTLLMGKHPSDSVKGQERPRIHLGTIIVVVILTILIVPVGLIAAAFVYYNHKKEVDEWQRNKIINNIS